MTGFTQRFAPEFTERTLHYTKPVPLFSQYGIEEAIERALARLHESRQQAAQSFHELEQLRDEVLAGGPGGVETALAQFPQADRQQLRQLVLQHQRELQRGKPPAASRKLFRYLRALREEQA